MPCHLCGEVRGRLSGIAALLQPYYVQGLLNIGCQAWQQAPFLVEQFLLAAVESFNKSSRFGGGKAQARNLAKLMKLSSEFIDDTHIIAEPTRTM